MILSIGAVGGRSPLSALPQKPFISSSGVQPVNFRRHGRRLPQQNFGDKKLCFIYYLKNVYTHNY
jgi:hypothetical protein